MMSYSICTKLLPPFYTLLSCFFFFFARRSCKCSNFEYKNCSLIFSPYNWLCYLMNNKVIVEKWAVKGGGLVGWLMPRRLDNGLFCYTYWFINSSITFLMIISVLNFDNSEAALLLTHLFQTPTIQFVYVFSTIFL